MAREGDEHPTEMPEKLFRQTAAYAEVREIAREAEAARARERADAAFEKVATMAGSAGAPLFTLGAMTAGSGLVRKALVAAAVAGWVVVIAVVLRWSGLV